MKRTAWIAVGTALLFGVSGANAQSLGDVARSNRKSKAHQSTTAHQFDNDNLPYAQQVSVVGPPPAAVAPAKEPANASSSPGETKPPEAKTAAPGNKPAAVDWKKKIEDQKLKIDTLSRELDIYQREYRLRAVAMYSDAGNRLRNSAQWDKEDAQYKVDLAEKQKTLDSAKQDLKDMEEQARKTP
jgi:hypothetical protein